MTKRYNPVDVFLFTMVILSVFLLSLPNTLGAIDQDNIVGYYSFDSDCIDNTGQPGIDGTNAGASNVAGGILNNACDFELTETDWVVIDNLLTNGLNIDNAHSMCNWVKMETTTSNMESLAFSLSTNNDYTMIGFQDSNNNFISQFSDAPTVNTAESGGSYEGDTDWHFICANVDADGKIQSLYVDGVDTGGATANTLNPSNVNRGRIGALYWKSGTELNFFDGLIDEVFVYNDSLTTSDFDILYNGGTGCNIINNPGGCAGSVTLNTGLDNNTNSTDNPFQFFFNGTVSGTTDGTFNCSFYVNASLEETKINLTLNNTNQNFTFADGNGAYLFNVTCINNASVTDSFTRNVFIDTITPKIQITGFTNNSNYIKGSDTLSYTLNYTDTNLEAINSTIFRLDASGVRELVMNNTFQSGILTSEYLDNFSDSLASTNWILGREYEIRAEAWDGHTDNELRYTPRISQNTLNYGDKLYFWCDDTASMHYEATRDSIKPEITFTEKKLKQTCYYETTGEFIEVKRQSDVYKYWFVDLTNRLWIDEKSEDYKITQLNPKMLMVEYKLKEAGDKVKSESFGDLNYNTVSYFFTVDRYTTLFSNKLNISSIILSGEQWQLVSNTTINLTGFRDLIVKLSLNSQKLNPSGSNELFFNLTLNGAQLASKSLRTMSSTNDIGVSGFFTNYTENIGSHNLELFFREVGVGDVNLSNIDYSLINLKAQNGEDVFFDEIETIASGSSSEYLNYVNLTPTPYACNQLIEFTSHSNSSGTDTIEGYIGDSNIDLNSTINQIYFPSSDVKRSIFNTWINNNSVVGQNNSAWAKNGGVETLTGDFNIMQFCLDTENGTKINNFYSTDSSTNPDNPKTVTGNNNILTSGSITIKNGTGIFFESSVSFQSTTGAQTPRIWMNASGLDCNTQKYRYLSNNNDVGNAFIVCTVTGLSVGTTYNVQILVDVEAGESLNIKDESLSVFEIIELDISEDNVPPSLILNSDIQNPLQADETASVTVQAFDINNDTISTTINWTVNGVFIATETQNLANGGLGTFTLASTNYVVSDILAATIQGSDGTLLSNIIFTANRTISEDTTNTLLASINATLSNSLNSQNNIRGGVQLIPYAIIAAVFLIAGMIAHSFIPYAMAGASLLMGGIILVTNSGATNGELINGFVLILIGAVISGASLLIGAGYLVMDGSDGKPKRTSTGGRHKKRSMYSNFYRR